MSSDELGLNWRFIVTPCSSCSGRIVSVDEVLEAVLIFLTSYVPFLAKLVAEQHFGGFMKKKAPEDDKKTWKERMEDMIGESKKKKVRVYLNKLFIPEMMLKMNFCIKLKW